MTLDSDLKWQYEKWRFSMYTMGYGLPIEIDLKVEQGELIAFQDYPDLDKENDDAGRNKLG